MKFIIKLFPEIMIKSDSVRKRFIKILTGNIRNILSKHDETVAVVRHWDYIEVRSRDEDKRQLLLDYLLATPGIHHILEVEEREFESLHHIFEQILELKKKMNLLTALFVYELNVKVINIHSLRLRLSAILVVD